MYLKLSKSLVIPKLMFWDYIWSRFVQTDIALLLIQLGFLKKVVQIKILYIIYTVDILASNQD